MRKRSRQPPCRPLDEGDAGDHRGAVGRRRRVARQPPAQHPDVEGGAGRVLHRLARVEAPVGGGGRVGDDAEQAGLADVEDRREAVMATCRGGAAPRSILRWPPLRS